MPKVEQFGASKVSTQVVQGARARSVKINSVGSSLVQGLKSVAPAIENVVQRQATTSSEEALVNFERDKNKLFFDPKAGYFNTQGRDAFDGAQGANDALNKLKEKYSKTLSAPLAKQMFSKAADAHIARGNVDVMRHASKGLQAWEISTVKAQVENSVENASLYWNDSSRLNVQNELGRQAVIDGANLQGITGEALNERLQTFSSSFALNAAEAATANSSTEGQKFLDSSLGKQLEGPDKLKVEGFIAKKVKAEKLQSDAQFVVIKATNLADTYDNLDDIKTETSKIKDPIIANKVLKEATVQHNRQKKILKENQGQNFNDAQSFIEKGGTVNQFIASFPDKWNDDAMTVAQRSTISSGKPIPSGTKKFHDIMSLDNREFDKIDLESLIGSMSNGDIEKIRARKNKSGSSIRSVSVLANSFVKSIVGKINTKSKEKKSASLYEDIQNAIDSFEETTPKGRKITPNEFSDLLTNFTKEISLDRSFFGIDILFPDKVLDKDNTPLNDLNLLNSIIDEIPDIDRERLITIYEGKASKGEEISINSLGESYKNGR